LNFSTFFQTLVSSVSDSASTGAIQSGDGGILSISMIWTYPGVFALLYMVYLFSDRSKLIHNLGSKISGRVNHPAQEWIIYSQKFLGFILLGPVLVLYGVIFDPGVELGLGMPSGPVVLGWSLIPVLATLVVSIFRSPKRIPWEFYPQVRSQVWTKSRIVLNIIAWSLYLWGYEFAFRGFLLFPLIPLWGLGPVILLNSALYGLAHIFKGPGESFGAFFLGILFCLIAVITNSFYIPFVIHVIMAVGNDLKAVQAHPDMSFDFSRRKP
jgi:membrane protease YdiL (CAAX protease family)